MCVFYRTHPFGYVCFCALWCFIYLYCIMMVHIDCLLCLKGRYTIGNFQIIKLTKGGGGLLGVKRVARNLSRERRRKRMF